jgi:hypothetical protein
VTGKSLKRHPQSGLRLFILVILNCFEIVVSLSVVVILSRSAYSGCQSHVSLQDMDSHSSKA